MTNNVSLNFSVSMMKSLNNLSEKEGIKIEELLIELITESIIKRTFEDKNRENANHLMTKNGIMDRNEYGYPQQNFYQQRKNNRYKGSYNGR